MFKWLKQKATSAAQAQCRTNIKLTAHSLILVADEADAEIESVGDSTGIQKDEVFNRQKRLFQELHLAHTNGISVEELQSILNMLVDEKSSTKGAGIAVRHTFESFLREI